jgi:S-adenosylmethionine:tRNA ribosyltransferase-isomerase
MKTDDFDYFLPKELIAQEPMQNRDQSRLLVMDVKTGSLEHRHFCDIVDYLEKGDVLVMNNSKVFPARLIGQRKASGGKVEVFLHRRLAADRWQCLLGGKRIKLGLKIEFGDRLACEVVKNNEDGTWEVVFDKKDKELIDIVGEIGLIPLPPYIKRDNTPRPSGAPLSRGELNTNDQEAYQTVYADDGKVGSVAAPTAGLHFTPELIEKIKNKGVQIEYVTLHVGLGTFAPVKVEDVTKHKMHEELVDIGANVAGRLQEAMKKKKRIIAVGTTSTRTLEAMAEQIVNWKLEIGNLSSWVNIFIYPGFEFKVVDAMITNFHLPKSTLLMLVSAFAGKDNIDKAYQEAIKEKYRFFSYGDAMLIK